MKKYINFTIDSLCNGEETKRFNVKNSPNTLQRKSIGDLIVNVLDPASTILDSRIIVSLGFCNKKLKNLINPNLNEDYGKGRAVKCISLNAEGLYNIIKELNDYDELFFIKENDREFVYVSFNKGNNRKHLAHITDDIFTWKNF